MSETGKFPPIMKIYTQIFKYWLRIKNTDKTLLKEALRAIKPFEYFFSVFLYSALSASSPFRSSLSTFLRIFAKKNTGSECPQYPPPPPGIGVRWGGWESGAKGLWGVRVSGQVEQVYTVPTDLRLKNLSHSPALGPWRRGDSRARAWPAPRAP